MPCSYAPGTCRRSTLAARCQQARPPDQPLWVAYHTRCTRRRSSHGPRPSRSRRPPGRSRSTHPGLDPGGPVPLDGGGALLGDMERLADRGDGAVPGLLTRALGDLALLGVLDLTGLGAGLRLRANRDGLLPTLTEVLVVAVDLNPGDAALGDTERGPRDEGLTDPLPAGVVVVRVELNASSLLDAVTVEVADVDVPVGLERVASRELDTLGGHLVGGRGVGAFVSECRTSHHHEQCCQYKRENLPHISPPPCPETNAAQSA